MKIITSQENLNKAVNIVEKVVSRNPSLPILNNILFKTENGRLKITATNLEMGISYFLGAKIEETGEIAIPAKIFSDFINNLKDEKVTLTAKDNILHINSHKYKTQVLGFDPKDFPIIPKIKGDIVLDVPSKILKNSLISVLDSVATSETRPELAGVFVRFIPNQVIFAATDSFRLAEKTIDIKHNWDISFILPRATVVEFIRILGDLNDDISIKISNNQIGFSNENFELVSRLIDGSYPDYKKVIPEKFISRLLIKKEEFNKSAQLAGFFSSNVADINISCEESSLTIAAKNSGKGEIKIVLDSVLKNEPFDLSLNHYYLMDGLKIIPTEQVILEYTGSGSPLVLRPEGNSKDLVYLIMPLRK